jgi:hypothetical protein
VQAERIRADASDNILARLGKQTLTRVLLKKAVPVMVARLGPRCPSASSRSMLTPIVQTVVVQHNIAGIATREAYIALRNASSEAEGVFISNLQATLQKNMGAFRKSVRDIVAEFVEEDTECPMINYVKEHVFGKVNGLPLVPRNHHCLLLCYEHPCPPLKGTMLSFVDASPPPPDVTARTRQVRRGHGRCLRLRRLCP